MTYTDADTGIIFNTWSASSTQTDGGLTVGFAFPEDALETDATEYIGLLVSLFATPSKATLTPTVLRLA